jgi:flagellar hook-associated protein 2
MVGGISFGGLASGLDTGAIIEALLNVERIPINALEGRKQAEQTKIDLFGTLQDHVSDLQAKAKELSTLSNLLVFSVTPSIEGVATFSASGSAVAGSHTLDVQALASVDRWAFDAVADPDAALATSPTSNVTFTYDGVNYDVPIQQGSSSLNNIAAEINLATQGAVSASVVNTGSSSNPAYQLVLAGSETGESFRISNLATTVGNLSVNGTGPDPSGTAQSQNNITVGSDAVAVIDGLRIQRDTNDFNDVVPGVSISATDISGGEINFTVESDREAIQEKVQGFVDAYNQVIDFINSQSTYSEEEGAGGELFGDSTLRTIQNELRRTMFAQSSTRFVQSSAGFETLRLVGIKTESDGRLSIDQSVMDAKMAEDLDAFADLFVDNDGFDNGGALAGSANYYVDITADHGLADDVARRLDRFLDGEFGVTGNALDGLFKARTEELQGRIKRFDEQIEAREFRLARFEENLVARFAALENLMGQLTAQQAFLGSQLQSNTQ